MKKSINNKKINKIPTSGDKVVGNKRKREENDIKNTSQKDKNPETIHFFKNIINDAYCHMEYNHNIFELFKSINNITYLIYTNKKNSIISYDLNENVKINEIKNAHKNIITHFSYYFDNINKRDLLISLSRKEKNLKLWKVEDWECLFNYQKTVGKLYFACFLNYNNIISCESKHEFSFWGPEIIRIVDLKGKITNEIDNYFFDSKYIECYYDKNKKTTYIISIFSYAIKSYDYDQKKQYKEYNINRKDCSNLIINDKDKIIKLIASCRDGYIKVWDFHEGNLISKIYASYYMNLYGICLWGNDYLFVGCRYGVIQFIDLNNEKIIKKLNGGDNDVLTIKKINHPKYGECILSLSFNSKKIKMWII